VLFKVRSASTARVEFGTDTKRNGIEFNGHGPFDLTLDLEMNLAPGVYSIEPYVSDGAGSAEEHAGPITYIQVRDEPGFMGHAQLKPRMILSRGAGAPTGPSDLARPS
jgi:hypothetical protein